MIFISIHAPRVGGDITDVSLCRRPDNFNPRPPCGGRPCPARRRKRRWEFQSTPPVWGATLLAEGQEDILRHFNPRPPCGGRLRCSLSPWRWTPFQSTPPVWGATPPSGALRPPAHFNPRPPCGGRPLTERSRRSSDIYFNPRPPCGGRPVRSPPPDRTSSISIHAPRVGGDYSIRQRYIDH